MCWIHIQYSRNILCWPCREWFDLFVILTLKWGMNQIALFSWEWTLVPVRFETGNHANALQTIQSDLIMRCLFALLRFLLCSVTVCRSISSIPSISPHLGNLFLLPPLPVIQFKPHWSIWMITRHTKHIHVRCTMYIWMLYNIYRRYSVQALTPHTWTWWWWWAHGMYEKLNLSWEYPIWFYVIHTMCYVARCRMCYCDTGRKKVSVFDKWQKRFWVTSFSATAICFWGIGGKL